jgi:imidazolonepropionase-like amidohydrolase
MIAGPLLSFVAREELAVTGDAPIRKVTTSEEAVALARAELARKPDFVKVWFIREKGDDLAAKERIVKDVADVAHGAGVRLAVHATELQTAKAALRVGADVLVHSVDDAEIDDEFVSLARMRKAVYVPTLFMHSGYMLALSNQWRPTPEESRLADPDVLRDLGTLDALPRNKLPDWLQNFKPPPERSALNPITAHNLMRMWHEGFVVPVGTDAGNIGTVHGASFFRETAWMAQAGLTPAEVLRAATSNGAKMMGREQEVGDVRAGMLADLVLLERDPLADVHNLSAIDLVVRAGTTFGGTRARGSP